MLNKKQKQLERFSNVLEAEMNLGHPVVLPILPEEEDEYRKNVLKFIAQYKENKKS